MIEWMMMGAFLTALGLSLWKLYVFFPNKELPDDDTNPLATEELTDLMIRSIVELYESDQTLTPQLLYTQVINQQSFDKEHYWRFNQNRLNQLLTHYYLSNPTTSTTEDIYQYERERIMGTSKDPLSLP